MSGTTHELRYRLLGPLTVLRPATPEPVDLGSPKQRAVLALLLLDRGRVVSTERLVDAIWEDDPPPSALASLQAYVSNLRRALRDGAATTSPIVRRAPGYLLDVPADEVDVAAFAAAGAAARGAADEGRWSDALSQADAALALWRGPLLEDLHDPRWLRADATRFDELRAELRELRVSALLAGAQVLPALVEAQSLRAEQPLRDRACWLHVLALYRAGRTPEALEELRRHAVRLDDELGLEPGAELRELELAILRQEPALAAWPRSPGWRGAAEVRTPRPQAEHAPPPAAEAVAPRRGDGLVGRAREAEEIDRMLDEARSVGVRALVLTGPAGIGKTRLAEELLARGRDLGFRDVWARCPEEEGVPAWWPIRQLVRALGGDPDAVLVPPPGADIDAARFAVYERVLGVLQAAAATTPLVVVVDDVQWADPTSARCLAYLVGTLRDVRVALVLTLRDGERAEHLAPLLGAIARAEGGRQLAVPPLGQEEVAELAGRVAGTPLGEDESRLLAERTGGNPLFVSEYARLSPEERRGDGIPLAVRTVLGRRLAGIDPEVLAVLRAAAVIGDVPDVEVLAAVTGLDVDTLVDLLDEAADEHVIVPAPGTGGYAFSHGLVREEVLAAIPPIRRQRLHARVAGVLADATTGDALSARAQHLVSALPLVDPADVLEACRLAAADAAERWSSEVAAGWWEAALRAFDLLPAGARPASERDDLLVFRVEALARAGRGQTVLDVVEAGLLDAVREGRSTTAGRLCSTLLRASGAWPWVSYGEDPGPLLERLAAVEPVVVDDPATHVRVLAALAVGSCYHPDPAVPDGMSRRALELAEGLGNDDALADATLGRILTYSGVGSHSRECLALLDRLRARDHAQRREDEAIGHSIATMAQFSLADIDAVEDSVRRGIAASELLKLALVRVQLRWTQATLAQWRGDFDDARRHMVIAARAHAQTELHSETSTGIAFLAARWELGTLHESPIAAPPTDVFAWEAAAAAARGDEPAARRALDAWLRPGRPVIWSTLGHEALLAHAVADLGLRDAAPALLPALEPQADQIANIGQVAVIGTVALACARLHALLGSDARARELLAQAEGIAQRARGRPELLRVRLELALLDGDDAELAAVAREAGRVGLAPVAARARAALA